MLKYTILYKNGKTWNGKAEHVDELNFSAEDIVHITVKNYAGYSVLYPCRGWKKRHIIQIDLDGHRNVFNVRTPNPKSVTKKQKAFDQAYLEWTMEHFAKYDNCPSVKEYKKWLWEQKLANSSKFTSPVSPGDTIGYWASDSNELKWVTIKPDELIIKSAYDKDVALKDKDGFIPWAGGECPVQHNIKVDLKFRDGEQSSRKLHAGIYYWRHLGNGSDIVAYKVVEEAKINFPSGATISFSRDGGIMEGIYSAWQTTDLSYPPKPPIKTTYTFWLGATGEIVDDK